MSLVNLKEMFETDKGIKPVIQWQGTSQYRKPTRIEILFRYTIR